MSFPLTRTRLAIRLGPRPHYNPNAVVYEPYNYLPKGLMYHYSTYIAPKVGMYAPLKAQVSTKQLQRPFGRKPWGKESKPHCLCHAEVDEVVTELSVGVHQVPFPDGSM